MSWGNWTFGNDQRQQAADLFLKTGNVNTVFGGSQCFSSSDCASGYTCAGGRCVPKVSQQSSDGTTSGCGEGSSGGPCNSLTTTNHSAINTVTGEIVYGDVIRYHSDGTMSSYQWTPVYASDGCTIAGCSLEKCGSENAVDCPGVRSCRYDAFGTINCFCGEPEPQGCSSFCTAYLQSYGGEAAGCSGLACDECSYCEEIFVSASGNCKQQTNGTSPCHCNPLDVPECTKCNEDGTTSVDLRSCQKCVTITNTECPGCDATVLTKTCCYTLEDWENGLSPVNRCQAEIDAECAELCDKPDVPPRVDPCQGECTEQKIGPIAGNCTSVADQISLADGHRSVITGCIEAGGQAAVLYNDCDMTGVPESCKGCDCNCHNDCPSCQLCGSDGTCYPDPSCPVNGTTVWEIERVPYTYYGCSYSPSTGGGGCVNPVNSLTTDGSITTSCAPLPHTPVVTRTDAQISYGPCVQGGSATYWRIRDANGAFCSAEFGSGGVGGTFCGGPPQPGETPRLVSATPC